MGGTIKWFTILVDCNFSNFLTRGKGKDMTDNSKSKEASVLWDIIIKRDSGYDIATIGAKFNIHGDEPLNLVEELEKAYLQDNFNAVALMGMKYLNNNHNPHTKIIITTTGAEIVEGITAISSENYIKD